MGPFTFAMAFMAVSTIKPVLGDFCRCGPLDPCWPTASSWQALNVTINGHLISNSPPAISCYPGPLLNLERCSEVLIGLSNSSFVGNNPVALCSPREETCPAVDYAAGELPGHCSLGSAPLYTVDAHTVQDVVEGINFARKYNLRVVIRNTAHDGSGRSTGQGSLQIWVRQLRLGINFHESFSSESNCTKSNWAGKAMTIAGGYVWREAFEVGKANNVVVVSGGDPTVGCLGGWAQGGGHGPASRNYGLGADQILEAKIVTASGKVVVANACQNSDLYRAIRGGGGGTYGVVVSTTIKAHPETAVVAQELSFRPRTGTEFDQFFDALAFIYKSYPSVNEAGYSGCGHWAYLASNPVISGSNSTTGYQHTMAIFNKSIEHVKSIFSSQLGRLSLFNESLAVNYTYIEFPSYHAYYEYSTRAGPAPVGFGGAYGSRFLDDNSLSSPALMKMLKITAGRPDEFTQSNVCVVSGGQVWGDASDPYSGVNPAWRKSRVHNVVARLFPSGANEEKKRIIEQDITYNKILAMRDLAPKTGSYMNEGDRLDPFFLENFYGYSLTKLEAAKAKYDPDDLFYCPTCVGSEWWEEDSSGRLCRK